MTVTVAAATLTSTVSGRSEVARLAAARRGAARIGRDAGGSGSLPHRQLDGQLVASDERHLEQPEQEHHHQRQGERQLDGGLAVGSPDTARLRSDR